MLQTEVTKALYLIVVDGSTRQRYLANKVILDCSSHFPVTVVAWTKSSLLGNSRITQFPSLFKVYDDQLDLIGE